MHLHPRSRSTSCLFVVALVLAGTAGVAVADDGTRLVYDGERLALEAGPEQQIHGETDVRPGTTLTVRIRSTDDDRPYLRARPVQVQADGTFSARFDLTDATPGTDVAVTVLDEGRRLARTTGRVVPCDGDCDGNMTAPTTERETGASTSLSVATFSQGSLGEAVVIPVSVGNASAVTLTVGGPSFNYVVNATLRDGDGDRQVDVAFHTGAAGQDDRTITPLDGADSATTVGRETVLEDALEPAEYDVVVSRGTDPGGPPDDEGTLVVHDSAWRTVDADRTAPPGQIGRSADETLGGQVPLDGAGTIAVGFGLALLSLRVLYVTRRP